MRMTISKSGDPAIMTVGELISQLCRWPDNAAVSFRCPIQQQELSFHRIESRSKGVIDIELNPAPERAPVVPA